MGRITFRRTYTFGAKTTTETIKENADGTEITRETVIFDEDGKPGIEIPLSDIKKGGAINAMPKKFIYPFFLVHMLAFGGSGFAMAYFSDDVPVQFLYMHGGIAISVYMMFYLVIFGMDQVKWMVINALLGVYGIYSEIGFLLSRTGRDISWFPWYVHVVPFAYYVLYTFLIRQAVLDITGSRDNEDRRKMVEWGYIGISVLIYSVLNFL